MLIFSVVRRNIHSSWLIAIMSCSLLIGVAICPGVEPSLFARWYWLAAGFAFAGIALWRQARIAVVCMSIAGFLIGVWFGSQEQLNLRSYDQFLNRNVMLHGVVADDIEKGSSGELRLHVRAIAIEGQRLPAEVWVSAASQADVKRSDQIILEGKLKPGFGSFAASMTFARLVSVKRIDGVDVARDTRDTFAEAVRREITEPAASLGLGYIVGQRSALPSELDEQLKIAGLTHIVVASGYNLTILVQCGRRFFMRISKFAATAAATCMIVGFVLITGFSPSMSRAALVAVLGLATWYYGRSLHPLVLLPLAAAITVGCNPYFIWGDLGWYLSFAAFCGVLFLAPLVHAYFWGTDKKPGMVRQILIETTCAQMVTMPIIALAFGQLSLYALPANLLVLPFVPLAMLLTFLAGIAGLCAPLPLLGMPAQFVLDYMIAVAGYIAELPGAQVELRLPMEVFLLSYGLMVLFAVWLWRSTRYNFLDKRYND